MKKTVLIVALLTLLASPLSVHRAEALSCLPIEDYVKTTIGKDELIFVATSDKRIEGTGYTAEALTVNESKQGYVPAQLFVYHESDETWGYFCNNGPKAEGSKGVYIASLDQYGKYVVRQRLELTDPLIKTLDADLKKAAVEGAVTEFSQTDRRNQIITTLGDLLREISILLKEYTYWK
ncbi:hypothetical protein K2Q16_03950 [Patescibacteria group bacterium]|nr:hypothetical protein [Patescibacteria group bacterium]